MIWEAPLALWLGLTVPAILALWVLRPRRPRVRVPSVMLWAGSTAVRRAARPWQRLRNHPLLWIQVVAAVLLALAAARPLLAGAGESRDVVVLLDATGSMRATDVAPDRFSAAKAAVLDLARNLGPSERLSVIRVDQEPRVLVTGARGEAPVEAALRDEAAGYGPGDMAGAAALATTIAPGPAEWVLVGDGGIPIPDDFQVPAGATVRFVPIGQTSGNVAITGLSLRETAPGALAIQAGLRNTGSRPVAGRLQILAEGELVGARDWTLDPNGESYVTWSGLSEGPAWFEARLTGVPPVDNLLAQDDEAWVASPGAGQASALLVSSGNLFLERALRLDGRVQAFQAATADWPALAAQAPYALTVFDGLWPDQQPAGSVLIVGPPNGTEFTPGQIHPSADHPLMRYVDWSDVHIAAARTLSLDSSWETVVDSDGGPLLAVRTQGSRREAVLAFSLSQSDLALRPAFPVLMANLLEWLLPTLDATPRAVTLGSQLSLDASPLAEQVWVDLPDGGREDLAPPWPPRPFTPPRPGVYRVVQANGSGTQEQLFTTDGYHPLEADVTPRRPALPGADAPPDPGPRGDRPLWPLLAAAVVGLSVLEWWVDARGR